MIDASLEQTAGADPTVAPCRRNLEAIVSVFLEQTAAA